MVVTPIARQPGTLTAVAGAVSAGAFSPSAFDRNDFEVGADVVGLRLLSAAAGALSSAGANGGQVSPIASAAGSLREA